MIKAVTNKVDNMEMQMGNVNRDVNSKKEPKRDTRYKKEKNTATEILKCL